MKLKLATTDNTPQGLVDESNSPEFGMKLMKDVIVAHLAVPFDSLGASSHYAQHTDLLATIFPDVTGAVVGFTMLSVIDSRAPTFFHKAMAALDEIYGDLYRRMMPRGSKTDLFVALSLDNKISPPKHMGLSEKTNLIETVPRIIIGECDEPTGPTAGELNKAITEIAVQLLAMSQASGRSIAEEFLGLGRL